MELAEKQLSVSEYSELIHFILIQIVHHYITLHYITLHYITIVDGNRFTLICMDIRIATGKGPSINFNVHHNPNNVRIDSDPLPLPEIRTAKTLK